MIDSMPGAQDGRAWAAREGRDVEQNQNAALYFVDRHIAEGRGDKVAFREADGAKRALSYGQLAEESGRFAGALGRHGVRREERIAMIVRDQIEFPVVFWGALKAGAIPVPLNTLLSSQVYEAILNDSRASILVVSEALWDVVKPAIEANRFLRAVLVIGEAPDGTESYRAFVKDAPVLEAVEANEDELAFWLYSSGSTGTPKGCAMCIHRSWRRWTRSAIRFWVSARMT
nr:AMP-binding protein [Aquicoccus sp. G2-2]MEA1114359.1 AMP-binding protein [Aquicoccus sp. G2-2]